MPYATATYDGQAIFGLAVSVHHQMNPTAQQMNSFFGIQGVQAVFGGTRGRVFYINGLLTAADQPGVRAAQAAIFSYADGVPRELRDTFGYTWSNVIFKGDFQEGQFVHAVNGTYSVGMAYKAVFIGLT